eukprot:4523384-Amphidinium_carterae.2
MHRAAAASPPRTVWAISQLLTISGYSPVELATGRRPPDQLDLELLTPEQLPTTQLRADETIAHLRRLSIKSHLEVRQNQDIKSRRMDPLSQDSSKFKDRGRWEPGRVVEQEGAMVRVEVKDRVQVVNQSKLRNNRDPWHDVPLPPKLMDAQAEDQSLPFMDVDVPDDQHLDQQGESSNLASAGDLPQCIRDLVQTIQDTFTIPKTKRENLKDKFDVKLAKTRPKQEPYLAAQLNMSSGMSVHRDKSNSGPSWTICFGTFKYGGRLWIEEESSGSSELVPPPSPIENGEKAKGRYHSTKGEWLKFDGNSLHAVEAVKDKGTRYSLTLFVPKYLNHLTEGHWQELQSHSFDTKPRQQDKQPTLRAILGLVSKTCPISVSLDHIVIP